jgi:hypothetical protein
MVPPRAATCGCGHQWQDLTPLAACHRVAIGAIRFVQDPDQPMGRAGRNCRPASPSI